MPLISICVPTYRNQVSLERLLVSIADQDFLDYELIIADDTPSAVLKSVVAPFSHLPGFQYLHNANRLGSPANWNYCLSLSQGDWIKMMHHDDWFATSSSLSYFAEAALEASGSPLIFSSCHAYRGGTDYEFTHAPFGEHRGSVLLDRQHVYQMLFANRIGCPSVTLFRRVAMKGFDQHLVWLVDVEAYIGLIQAGGLVYLPKPLVNVTFGASTQITTAVENDQSLKLRETMYIYDKYAMYDGFEITVRLGQDLRLHSLGRIFQVLFDDALPCRLRSRVIAFVAYLMAPFCAYCLGLRNRIRCDY
ncbi:glycosyltransferase family 2 protein [Synechococcus sp. CS-1332]|uniref:glycosyltransferase family 2 protein n=1 Tax=Synechococcus sp. CS-1332 TaxID=2847972 RepID=UPI00223A8DC6|nr:glycosyltransferase family 2 protein [Synechococcus sp. CS-1332]MCT0209041.1 glycosyltransferase family 2 protein [Synechococcus sp. CS-1332]